jgi:hypothetical protein
MRKQKLLRRILAIILSVAMVLGGTAVTAMGEVTAGMNRENTALEELSEETVNQEAENSASPAEHTQPDTPAAKSATGPAIMLGAPMLGYQINEDVYSWTDGEQTVTLSGNDILTILNAPTEDAKITIDVASDSGSSVTIVGDTSKIYNNVRINVQKDINLILDNLKIVAPDTFGGYFSYPALHWNSSGGAAALTVIGQCSLTGSMFSSGIGSTGSQQLTISGNGGGDDRLIAQGGSYTIPDINAGQPVGNGIYMFGLTGEGAKLTIQDVAVEATGGNDNGVFGVGGYGIFVLSGSIEIIDATVTAASGTDSHPAATMAAIMAGGNSNGGGDLSITNSTVTAIGADNASAAGDAGISVSRKLTINSGTVVIQAGDSTSAKGGSAISAGELQISGGTVTATAGNSTDQDGGIAIYIWPGTLQITGGTVTASGGNGKGYGGHGIYVANGAVTMETGANLTAVGGNGTTQGGGVGLRAYNSGNGNTVTIANSAGDIYIRGGQGATVQRASIMGSAVYIGTGNVGDMMKEVGASALTIKNTPGGDDVYKVSVSTILAADVTIRCDVSGGAASAYTYRAKADLSGSACLWLPAGAQTLTADGYPNTGITVATNDTNTVVLNGQPVVTAHNSAELQTYMAASYVTTINLVDGTTYEYPGGTVSRDLTINGNGAVIVAGTGVNDTVVRSDDKTVSSSALGNYADVKTFLKVEGTGSVLRLNDVVLRNGINKNGADSISDGIFTVINVKTGGSLAMDNVALESFHNNPVPGNNLNFGIHAEPGAISTVIENSRFDSSNAFRNAVAIRSGALQVSNNIFQGTDYPERLRQSDGYEYAIYIYGGIGSVTQNYITGYDSTTQLGYSSAGIAVIGFYSTEVTVENNELSYNESGIDVTRTWSPWSTNTYMMVNGNLLDSSEAAYTIGEALKAANLQEYVSVSLDQNDEVQLEESNGDKYYAVLGGYRSPWLTTSNAAGNTLTVQFPLTDIDILNAADLIEFEMQVDGDENWTAISPVWVQPTEANLTLTADHEYCIRAKVTHASYVESGDPIERTLITYSNPVFVTQALGGPEFVGGTQSITVRPYPDTTDLRDQLYVSDLDVGQTLTWTVVSGPSHGTLTGFPVTASTNGSGGIFGTVGSTDTRIPAAVAYTPDEGYVGSDSFTIQVSDGTATDIRVINVGVNLASGVEVTANNSEELEAAINDPAVATINLKAGTIYQIMGAEINRSLTINGNNAVIEALSGVGQSFDNQTIYHLGMPDANGNRRYRGNLFWYVKDGGSLAVENLTLKNAAISENEQGLTGIFAAILLNDAANLSLTGVSFEDFWFKNGKFEEQNNLSAAQGLYSSYSDMSYGVYTDYNCTGDITVSNSTFGSSNAFRDAIHIYNGNSVNIENCTLTGTEHPDRLREADRYEYGMFLYGGNCSVINNNISGYDSKKNANYSSAGMALLPYYDLSAAIEDNTIQGNDSGLDITGGWEALNPAPEVEINAIVLNTEDNGFKIGEGLKASNTISENTGANIYIKLDQNDDDNAFVYYTPFLSVNGTNKTKPTLNFSQAADAVELIATAITIEVQKSEDNGQSWTTASLEEVLNNGSTSAVVNLEANKSYTLRLKMTHDNNQTPNTVITGYSDAVTFAAMSSEAGIASILSKPVTAGTEAGTSAAPKTVSISVESNVDTVALNNIVKSDSGATVTFYGTDNAFTTPATGSVNLTPGAATVVYIKVAAADGTVLHYKVTINRAIDTMNVTVVKVTAFNAGQVPSQATIEVTMDDIGLNAGAFTLNNMTTPSSAATVNNVTYSGGKYILSVSGLTYYDSYSLTITKTGYTSYTNSSFYGELAAAGDLNLVNEPNMFPTYSRALTSPGIVTISNSTYAANDKLYSGPVYTAIDTNNGNPDNGTITRLIGIFVKAPEGAKGVKTLRLNGQMERVTEDSLIDSNPNYQETVASGKAVDNEYWEKIAFVPLYTQIASERQSDQSRILVDPADRFRIIEWYDNEECTGTPVQVIRLMVKVEYTGTPIGTDAGLASVLGQTVTAGTEAGTSENPKTASINVTNATTTVSAGDIVKHDTGATITFYGTDSTFAAAEAGSINLIPGTATEVCIKVVAANGKTLYYKVTINRTASGDAGLTSVLGQAITAGTEAGTGENPKTAVISVANAVAAVTAGDIVKSHAGSTVAFYGTDSSFTAVKAGNVNLTENDATTVYIKVTAQDTTTVRYYRVAINRAGSSDTGLTSILNQAITTGTEAGTITAPKTASINVANTISTVSAEDIVKSHPGETVAFYGTDSSFTTVKAGNVNLTENDATTVYIKVTAQDTTTVRYYRVAINRTGSSNTGLTSILGQAITPGTEAGTITAPKTASINVTNATSSVAISDIAKSHAGATVTFYGTDRSFMTPASGSVSLASGGDTTVFIKITSQDASAVRYYAITIRRAASSSTSNPVPGPGPIVTPTPGSAADKVEHITVDVKQGETDNTVAKINIERTTHTDGSKSDAVTYQEEKARETIEKLKEEGMDVARILLPGADGGVSRTQVTIPSASLNTLSAGNVNLQIDTEDAKIEIPKASLAQANQNLEGDLYFKLVPVKEEEQKREVTQRAIFEVGVISNNENTNISALGIPMTIETNMPSTDVDITLPLSGISIPSNPVEREAFLGQLAVFIEHSDGEKELVQGEIVEYRPGVLGIKFHITKFSTFTIVKTEKSSACDVIKVTVPAKAVIKGSKITATVDNATKNLTVKVTVSDKASWKLYSDKACSKELKNQKLTLKAGANTVYLKTTAEDGKTSKIYTVTITRRELPKQLIIIANKYDFADAFVGGVPALQSGGEVITTGITSEDAKKLVNYIKKNYTKQDKIYILGLEKAVNKDLEKLLKKEGYTDVVRIGGKDKYETAKKTAGIVKLSEKVRVVLVNGTVKPEDAESIQKICAEKGYPILLVQKNNLTTSTLEALKEIKPVRVYLLGDQTKISSKVADQVSKELKLKNSSIIRIKSGKEIK